VLDIWVMGRMVGDQMMDIVVLYPPSDAKTTDEIGNENAQ